jgi:primosomal protein N'
MQKEITEYCAEQLFGQAAHARIMEELLQTHVPGQQVPAHEVPPPRQAPEQDLRDELQETESQLLNAEQAAVQAAVTAAEAGLFVLSGGPGTGKTFVTKHLIHGWRKAGKRMIIAATTGAAATRVSKGANTVHKAFSIPLNGMYLASLRSYDPLYQQLKEAEVILIDEMSMLSAPLLNLVLFRLQQCGGFSDVRTMLQHKLIVLVGDHAQVRREQLGVWQKCLCVTVRGGCLSLRWDVSTGQKSGVVR